MRRSITLQIHRQGEWHDAATVDLHESSGGIPTRTDTAYDQDYAITSAPEAFADGKIVIDERALSVAHPVDLAMRVDSHWPAFLLDFLPQGRARERLARFMGEERPDEHAFDLPLLLRTAGGPIGNMRVKEAREQEQERLAGERFDGLTEEEIFERSDAFRDMADRLAYLASGSSGVQGEWPKILMTRATDGLWYPDPVVPDDDAADHAIIKMSKGERDSDRTILGSEAPYLEVARTAGLRVARPLRCVEDTLLIPRFDREVRAGGGGRHARRTVIRHGQESLASAIGAIDFGHRAPHEDYIAILARVCSDPLAEAIEYVKRDVLDWAMGNTDNHGRNTALQKKPGGWIGLTPLFDFAPMRLDPRVIGRSTTWTCVRGRGFPIDWSRVCAAVAGILEDPAAETAIAAALHGMADVVRDLPRLALDAGVSRAVIDQALRGHAEIADGLRSLEAVARRQGA